MKEKKINVVVTKDDIIKISSDDLTERECQILEYNLMAFFRRHKTTMFSKVREKALTMLLYGATPSHIYIESAKIEE